MLDDFKFGEYTIKLDCDVLVADGGTRTASITGACVAVVDAFDWLVSTGRLAASPVKRRVAAVSVGVIDGEPRLDLDYEEDVRAGVDMNVVMSSEGRFVEVQGTGEHGTFDRGELDALVDLAVGGPPRARRGAAPRARHLSVARARPLLLATRSEGKLRELRPLFADARHRRRRSRAKRASPRSTDGGRRSRCMRRSRRTRSPRRDIFTSGRGMPTVADDSGLAVRALGGRPGVHSKRWSGRADLTGQALDDENNRLLLACAERRGGSERVVRVRRGVRR